LADDKQQDDGPLSSEALKRDEWRGGETILQEEGASGHTLPESERDRAAQGGGQKGSGSAGTILPPD
jgi:hypothetical protein